MCAPPDQYQKAFWMEEMIGKRCPGVIVKAHIDGGCWSLAKYGFASRAKQSKKNSIGSGPKSVFQLRVRRFGEGGGKLKDKSEKAFYW